MHKGKRDVFSNLLPCEFMIEGLKGQRPEVAHALSSYFYTLLLSYSN